MGGLARPVAQGERETTLPSIRSEDGAARAMAHRQLPCPTRLSRPFLPVPSPLTHIYRVVGNLQMTVLEELGGSKEVLTVK